MAMTSIPASCIRALVYRWTPHVCMTSPILSSRGDDLRLRLTVHKRLNLGEAPDPATGQLAASAEPEDHRLLWTFGAGRGTRRPTRPRGGGPRRAPLHT